MTAFEKISYPVLLTTPSSCLFTCSLSPTFTHHRRAMTHSPLSILPHFTSLIFFSSIHKYNHYFFIHSVHANYIRGLLLV
jgi:hypothetical protein